MKSIAFSATFLLLSIAQPGFAITGSNSASRNSVPLVRREIPGAIWAAREAALQTGILPAVAAAGGAADSVPDLLDGDAASKHWPANQQEYFALQGEDSGGFTDANARDEAALAETRFLRVSDPGKNISHFRERMTFLESKVKVNASTMAKPGSVKMLIGITTMGYESAFRDAIRDTWLKHPGVCRLNLERNQTPPANPACRFFVTFVMGKNSTTDPLVEEENRKHHDIVQATFPDGKSVSDPASHEGIRRGHLSEAQRAKTDLWFRFAAANFGWATHIAKADLDTWPHLEKVLADVADLGHSKWAHKEAKPAGWKEEDGIYYGVSCGGGLGGFKQGAFYMLSRSLLKCMFTVDAYKYPWHDNGEDGGGEDIMMWYRVRRAMKSVTPKEGKCRDPWWVGPGDCGNTEGWTHPIQ